MSNEGFLRRWARLKSTGGAAEAVAEAPPAAPAPAAPAPVAVPASATHQDEAGAPPRPLPTLADAARLTPDADFSAFVAKGVDKSVQRLALKKLFADPHFNAIDGLDMYMSDYNKAAPLPPGMLASLKHAPGVLNRLLDDQQKAAEAAEAAQAVEAAEAGVAIDTAAAAEPAEQAPPSTRQGNA